MPSSFLLHLAWPLLTSTLLGTVLADTATPPSCYVNDSVPNGGFDDGTLASWVKFIDPKSGSNASVVQAGQGRGYAAQLTVALPGIPGEQGISAEIVATANVCKAVNYSITFDYKKVSEDSSCNGHVAGDYQEPGFIDHHYSSPSLNATEWTTVTFCYPNYIADLVGIRVDYGCGNPHQTAKMLFDNFKLARFSSLEPNDCPGRPIRLPNAGFESGQLAPWNFSRAYPTIPPTSVVSPGYQSNHALQIEVPINQSYWEISQRVPHDVCLGYNYTATLNVNWVNYSYQPTHKKDGCVLRFGLVDCLPAPGEHSYVTAPAPNSGWQSLNTTCIEWTSKALEYYVTLDCSQSRKPRDSPFTFQLDGFNVRRTDAYS